MISLTKTILILNPDNPENLDFVNKDTLIPIFPGSGLGTKIQPWREAGARKRKDILTTLLARGWGAYIAFHRNEIHISIDI